MSLFGRLFRRGLRHDIKSGRCSGAGQRICLERGYHSWFHHSQDSMRPDYPPGYRGND
jgi:hypothetical protein